MTISLPEQELLRIDARNRKIALHCLAGTVWVTDGSGRDCLLVSGHTFRICNAETVVVEALRKAEVRLLEEEMTSAAPAAFRLAVS